MSLFDTFEVSGGELRLTADARTSVYALLAATALERMWLDGNEKEVAKYLRAFFLASVKKLVAQARPTDPAIRGPLVLLAEYFENEGDFRAIKRRRLESLKTRHNPPDDVLDRIERAAKELPELLAMIERIQGGG